MEKKDNVKMNHWKDLVVHLIMMDIFHDDSIVDQIEMMVNDYHNNLIDHYLFDQMMKVDNHHYEDDDNVSMDHSVMKQVENSMKYVMNDNYNHYLVNFLVNNYHYDHHYVMDVHWEKKNFFSLVYLNINKNYFTDSFHVLIDHHDYFDLSNHYHVDHDIDHGNRHVNVPYQQTFTNKIINR